MAWFTRFTRFGDDHLVYAQEADNYCGIACVMMCVFKINKLRPGATAVTQEQEIYRVYDRHFQRMAPAQRNGTPYDGSIYTYAGILAATLNDLNCGTWEAVCLNENAVSQMLRGAFQIVLIVVLMVVTNWRLTLAGLTVLGLLCVYLAG